MERKYKIAVNPGLRQVSDRWLLLLGTKRWCQRAAALEILPRTGRRAVIKSYQHFQEIRTLPSSLSSYWDLSIEEDSIMPETRIACSCNPIPWPHTYCSPWAGTGECPPGSEPSEIDCDQVFALLNCRHLLPESPSGVAEWTLLFNPCSFQSDLLLQLHGCESVHCPGMHWELCAARLSTNRAA